MKSNGITAVGLLVEYLKDPVGIDCVEPRLSWHVVSDGTGQVQSGYQILAASSGELLDKDKGDLWDSGKVESDETLHIRYGGKKLESYQRCYWKVRVWDKDGKVSGWSEVGFWSMGVLDAGEWKGKWLGYVKKFSGEKELAMKGKWKQEAPSPMFRKGFTAKKQIAYATLHVCGLGLFEAYINGEKVGDHVLDPAFTRYDRASLYVTHDVTDMLAKGKNAIGVMLGNGWYNVFCDAAWDFDKAPWRGKPKMLAQLRIEYTDGTVEYVVSDDSWKAATGPVYLDGIRQGECYDARLEIDGWTGAGFDDSSWARPEIVEAPGGMLRAQMIAPMKVVEKIDPALLDEPKPGVFVYDMGQNIAGWVRLKVSGPRGTKITIRYGERIFEDGMLDQKEVKRHIYEEESNISTYTLKGDGVEVWEPKFSYYGFQYVEVTGFPGTPTLDSIDGCVVHTAFENSGEFECSDHLLNKIQNCALWSYRGNFHGIPTDCPHREKNGWMGDAHLAAEQAMYNWANGAGYSKWLMDLHDEQKESGALPGIVPTGGWGYSWGNGPAWDSAYLLIPWYMYQYYGDTGILAKHYDRFTRYVDYLTSRGEDLLASREQKRQNPDAEVQKKPGYIIMFGLNDWAPAKTQTPGEVTSTVYYYIDTMITAKAAEILGKKEDAKKYTELAEKIKKAFNDTFYKGDGIYDKGSQTALCFPLYYGMVPEKEQRKVLAKFVKNIKDNGYHIDTGILGAKAVYNVLAENGELETAYKMLMQKSRPSYGYWIEQGATTLWEQWSGAESRNHIMFGDISAWFYKNLAGIRLDESGTGAFKHFVIKPQVPEGLESVRASYNSIRGVIRSEWKRSEGSFSLEIEVPANTTATLYMPSKDAESMALSKMDNMEKSDINFIKKEGDYLIFEVGSGSMRMSTRY